jgi:hypothetical protein
MKFDFCGSCLDLIDTNQISIKWTNFGVGLPVTVSEMEHADGETLPVLLSFSTKLA